jgi:DNA-binding MarR family transcriptional regulator
VTSSDAVLDQDFGFVLSVVLRSYVKAAGAVVSEIPGGPRGYQVLAAAIDDETGSQGAVAQRLGVDRTVMTYLVDDLEQGGFVVRKADPADRRNRRIVATASGRKLWARSQKQLRLVEDHVLGCLSDEERATLRSLLQRLAARANELDPVGSACQVINELEGDTAPPAVRRSARSRRVDVHSER